MDPIATARYGMMAATRRFEASAARTVQDFSGVDYAQEAVEQISAKHQLSAMVGLVHVAEDMWDSLLALQTDRR